MQSPYEKLLQRELKNPIISHTFDPIGCKFQKENVVNQKRRGKAKVIVKSSLFSVSGKTANENHKEFSARQKKSQRDFFTTFGRDEFAIACHSDQRQSTDQDFESVF